MLLKFALILPSRKMSDLKKYFTRPIANKGISIPLADPFTGELTGDCLFLRGQDSDEFRRVDAEVMRRSMELYTEDKEAAVKYRIDNENRLLAALVIGWTQEPELSQEKALELVENAPQIADQIRLEAGVRSNFLKHALNASSQEPTKSSS